MEPHLQAFSFGSQEGSAVSTCQWLTGTAASQGGIEYGQPEAMAIAEDSGRGPAQPADPGADMFEDPPAGVEPIIGDERGQGE